MHEESLFTAARFTGDTPVGSLEESFYTKRQQDPKVEVPKYIDERWQKKAEETTARMNVLLASQRSLMAALRARGMEDQAETIQRILQKRIETLYKVVDVIAGKMGNLSDPREAPSVDRHLTAETSALEKTYLEKGNGDNTTLVVDAKGLLELDRRLLLSATKSTKTGASRTKTHVDKTELKMGAYLWELRKERAITGFRAKKASRLGFYTGNELYAGQKGDGIIDELEMWRITDGNRSLLQGDHLRSLIGSHKDIPTRLDLPHSNEISEILREKFTKN